MVFRKKIPLAIHISRISVNEKLIEDTIKQIIFSMDNIH